MRVRPGPFHIKGTNGEGRVKGGEGTIFGGIKTKGETGSLTIKKEWQ